MGGECAAERLEDRRALRGRRIGGITRRLANEMTAAGRSFLDPDSPEDPHLPVAEDVGRAVRKDFL